MQCGSQHLVCIHFARILAPSACTQRTASCAYNRAIVSPRCRDSFINATDSPVCIRRMVYVVTSNTKTAVPQHKTR